MIKTQANNFHQHLCLLHFFHVVFVLLYSYFYGLLGWDRSSLEILHILAITANAMLFDFMCGDLEQLLDD